MLKKWRFGEFLSSLVTAILVPLIWSGVTYASSPIQAHTTALLTTVAAPKASLVIGSEQDYPPFATGMTDESAGGFTVELWNAVAAEAGVNSTVRVRPFHVILQEFKEGKIDVLINLAQSEGRTRFVDFTVPHVIVNGAVFVRKGEASIRSEGDLAGKAIIVLNADLAHDYAGSQGWEKQLILVETAAEGFRLLASGKHDAMLLSKLAGMQTLHQLGLSNVEALNFKAGFSQKFSFAVHKGQSNLLAKLNESLALTKANGTYNALYEKWFGIYEVKEIGVADFLKYGGPLVMIFLVVSGYFFRQRQIERKEAGRKYRDLYDHAPDMFLSIDSNNETILECNQTLLGCTGYSKEDIVGRSASELFHPDCVDLVHSMHETFLLNKETHGVELQLQCKDGSTVDVSVNASAVCDESGNLLHSRTVLRDITERKKLELIRNESESRFRLMADSAPVFIWVTNQDNAAIWFNKTSLSFRGRCLDQETGEGWIEAIHPNDLPFCIERFSHLTAIRQPFSLEFRIKRYDGKYRWVFDSAVPRFDGEGNYLGYVGSGIDITDRIEAETKLRTLSTAIEQSPISVVITDVDSNIEYVNPRFVETTGYTAQEVIGQNPRILKSGLTPEETFRELWGKLTLGQVWHGELLNKRKNGEIYWEEAHISPVQNEAGILTSYVALKIDISQRKLNEETIRQSQEHFRSIIEASPIPYALNDAKLNIVYLNSSFTRTFGYTLADISTLADWWPKAYPDSDYRTLVTAAWQMNVEKAERENRPFEPVEAKIRCKNGDTRIALVATAALSDLAHDLDVVTFFDITALKLAEKLLRDSETSFKNFFDTNASTMLLIDPSSGNIVAANKSATVYYGYPQERLVGMPVSNINVLAPEGLANEGMRAFSEDRDYFLFSQRLASGEERDVEVYLTQIERQGRPLLLSLVYDITERKLADAKLRLAATVFTHAREGIAITTADGTIIDINETFSQVTGYSRSEVVGHPYRFPNLEPQAEGFFTELRRILLESGYWSGELWTRRKNGDEFAVILTISAVRDAQGITNQYVVLFSDITLIKAHERKLEHLAHFDVLTTLPNRVLLADRLQQAMAQTLRRGQILAVVYLDLDGFKDVNDNYGHEDGDQLLLNLAIRMKETLREGDTLARLGGDEFVAVLTDLSDANASIPMLDRLLAAAALPVNAGSHVLQVSASLGVTFYPQVEAASLDQLLRQADQAMYQAKVAGRNRYQFFQH